MNPISKRKLRGWNHTFYNTHTKSHKQTAWDYSCPECPEATIKSNGYRTRKKAKDALHNHMQTQHAGPGLGV